MMLTRKIEREIALLGPLSSESSRVIGRVDESREDIRGEILSLVAHDKRRLTIVLELRVVGVTRALGLEREPVVLHVARRLVEALG